MLSSYADFQRNIKNDNSDTFWLVFADYCDENEISHDIREQINTLHPEIWHNEWLSSDKDKIGSLESNKVGMIGEVGSVMVASGRVGCDNWIGEVGGNNLLVMSVVGAIIAGY